MTVRGRDLPLWMWLVGYAEFLFQASLPGLLPLGLVSAAACLGLFAVSAYMRMPAWISLVRSLGTELRQERKWARIAYLGGFALLGASLALGLFSALRPPFLPQEQDAVMYQMGVPRQLLLQGTLGWIGWSMPDLWPMAMQWGFAPLSLAFGTINKLPQFLCTLGVAACLLRIAEANTRRALLPATLPVMAVLGSHGVGIQIGSGMMDLPALYFLLLPVSALLEGRIAVAALALSVYAGSKATHPFQVGAAVAAAAAWLWLSRRPLRPFLVRFLPLLCLFSMLLLARPAYLSLRETGTPLFPFLACKLASGSLCEPGRDANLRFTVDEIIGARHWYGNGRGPVAFVRHLWAVAVPSRGVNNEFDYPLGLPWLLFVVFALFSMRGGGWKDPLLLLAFVFWALWWPNAQQSRWLYPTLAFGWLGTLGAQARAKPILPVLVGVSLAFTLLSQVRSLKPTAAMRPAEIRAREEAKVKWAEDGKLVSYELLYVDRPAREHAPAMSVWVLK